MDNATNFVMLDIDRLAERLRSPLVNTESALLYLSLQLEFPSPQRVSLGNGVFASCEIVERGNRRYAYLRKSIAGRSCMIYVCPARLLRTPAAFELRLDAAKSKLIHRLKLAA